MISAVHVWCTRTSSRPTPSRCSSRSRAKNKRHRSGGASLATAKWSKRTSPAVRGKDARWTWRRSHTHSNFRPEVGASPHLRLLLEACVWGSELAGGRAMIAIVARQSRRGYRDLDRIDPGAFRSGGGAMRDTLADDDGAVGRAAALPAARRMATWSTVWVVRISTPPQLDASHGATWNCSSARRIQPQEHPSLPQTQGRSERAVNPGAPLIVSLSENGFSTSNQYHRYRLVNNSSNAPEFYRRQNQANIFFAMRATAGNAS